ncbi:hypothetical protein SAMN06298216_1712 [Spirosomataceae bacterium TFI 002]|nr:hypothetical protein SAMN06298216_1712 [Spirosomataceae bacterium TFI 002]
MLKSLLYLSLFGLLVSCSISSDIIPEEELEEKGIPIDVTGKWRLTMHYMTMVSDKDSTFLTLPSETPWTYNYLNLDANGGLDLTDIKFGSGLINAFHKGTYKGSYVGIDSTLYLKIDFEGKEMNEKFKITSLSDKQMVLEQDKKLMLENLENNKDYFGAESYLIDLDRHNRLRKTEIKAIFKKQ